MYYQFADGLCSNLTTIEVSCPMKIGRVSKKYKKLVISLIFLLLPSSHE